MRVLMVQTPSVEGLSRERVYPIGIVTLATHLKEAGHEVELLDMNIEADSFGSLKEKLLDYRPEVVGLSLRNIDPLANKTSSLVPPFVATVRLVAAFLPGVWIVAGGTGFSLFPRRLMEELPQIQYGLVGEAETSFPALLASLDNPPELKGLCRRKGEKLLVNPPSAEYDMARYAVPRRELLSPRLYQGLNNYVPAMGIETKRGCRLNCAYCVYPRLQGKKLRCRQTAGVVDEIEFLHKEYGIKDFHFNDPVVNLPHGHLEDICREILRRKLRIRWSGFFREDHLDEGNIFLFEEAGCNCFSFSPDGLCDQSLRVLGKNLCEDDVLKAAGLAARTDVVTMYHFMVNVPGENAETIRKGLSLLDRLYELHSVKINLGTVVLNNIRILPGTPVAERARREGVIGPETDLLYPVYYNPPPYETLRYRLETHHLHRNVFMWLKSGELP
ncbi:radical SAM domain protein [Desulfocucumis palustris]|uniref:Radical SAM domain protein n=1 Tax=Desulfocucumis palustris TaxID=1898651 RepID=A0A2L2XFI5_9FIRM|nr:radical SAM domain protein [Desulfocucumis palustris]